MLIIMKYLLICLTIFTTTLFAQNDFSFMGRPQVEPKLKINNAILAKVNGKTISVIDVMKKMDLLFLRSYPQMVESKPARYQFYVTSWRQILNEMIDTELILADAKAKELKLTEGEVREEMEERYGPNIISTLSQLNLEYDEAWKMVKNEMIVQRMNWFYVNSKALQAVSPQRIRDAYTTYCEENPGEEKWNYQIISIRPDEKISGAEVSQEIYSLVRGENKPVGDLLETLHDKYDSQVVQVSKDYEVTTQDLSDSHKTVLANLEVGEYSEPISQVSRIDQKEVHRIFLLKDHSKTPPPAFATVANQLRDTLLQQEVQKEGTAYIEKLRKHYGHEQKHTSQMVPNDFEPFVLE